MIYGGENSINVYDFDNTIYNGESMLDFYLFCLKRRPKLVKYLFVMLYNLVKYKLCLINEEEFILLAQKYAGKAVSICPDADALAEKFWKKHAHKIGAWYNVVKKEDDVVVSASFGFLLKPAMELLSIKKCVSSEIDLESGIISKVCFGKLKVDCFKEKFPNEIVNDFYTDSMNDVAFMSLAVNNVYIVKKGNIKLYNKAVN